MISEQYVSFEVARLLKEKGIGDDDVIFHALYDDDGDLINLLQFIGNSSFIGYDINKLFPAPTQQMAMRWLREVHHIHVCPEYKAFFQERPKLVYHAWVNKIIGIDRYFKQGIQDLDKLDSDYFYFRSCKTYHDTYEDACEECVEFALRNLIEKGGSNE